MYTHPSTTRAAFLRLRRLWLAFLLTVKQEVIAILEEASDE